MNKAEEPATEQQMAFLNHFGCTPDHPLTRAEAAALLREYQQTAHAAPATRGQTAYQLRVIAEQARTSSVIHGNAQELQGALHDRQQFWMDTCREVSEMHHRWPQVLDLYQKHGCRFVVPSALQTQEVLEALDSAMPFWDRDHPELFYSTLELNFPEVVRRA